MSKVNNTQTKHTLDQLAIDDSIIIDHSDYTHDCNADNNLLLDSITSASLNSPGGYSVPWTNGVTGISIVNDDSWTTSNSITSGKIVLDGADADIEVNGHSLMSTLRTIEERLNILKPNPEMEKDWDQLRELGEQYRKLEAELKEKSKMWSKLKAMPPPEL